MDRSVVIIISSFPLKWDVLGDWIYKDCFAFHRSYSKNASDTENKASEALFYLKDVFFHLCKLRICLSTCYNLNLTVSEIKALDHQLSLLELILNKCISPRIMELVASIRKTVTLEKSSRGSSRNHTDYSYFLCAYIELYSIFEISPLERKANELETSLENFKDEIGRIRLLLHSWPIKTKSLRSQRIIWDICLDDSMNLFLEKSFLRNNLISYSYYGMGGIWDTLLESIHDLPTSPGVTVLPNKHNTMNAMEYSEHRTILLKVERKNTQFCLFLHDSCFQEITKDIACYTGIEEEKNSLCKLSQKYVDLPKEVVNVMRQNKVDTNCERTSLKQEFNRKQIESLVRDFFKNEKKLDSGSDQKPENSVHEDNHMLKQGLGKEDHSKEDHSKEDHRKEDQRKDGHSEPGGLLDVIPEIFTHVEIRPSEVFAFPATQQRVLEPFLNKFTSPESTPSKHDTMAVEFLRLCTMHDYPSTNGPSLLRLAQNGFYYDGNGTELICFSCDVKIRNWKYDDIPSEIHQKMSANCRFLIESGDGNVPVPRVDIHEELASSGRPAQVISGVEADGPRTAAADPPNNTAVLTSADSAEGQSKTPPRGMVIKHPEYADRSKRLASYKTFPRHMKQHPADMTDAGFYYAGFGDCCRCFHCGVGLRNWDPEDNPWIEHARWSPDCPYIFEMKGQAFIDLVQEAARAAEMADDDDENEDDARNTEEKSATTPASSTAASASAHNSQTPTEQSSSSIENNVVKTSEATISQGTPVDKAPVAVMPDPKIIKAPLRSPAAQTLVHEEKIKPRYVMEAIDELVKKEGWTAFNIENIRKYLKIQEDGRKSANSASAADPNVLKQENKELKDLTICKICLDEKVSIVFLPCGHLVSCPQCAPALTKCPICRKVIKGTVRTNLVEKNHAIAKKT